MLTRIRPAEVHVTSDIGQSLAALQLVAAAYPEGAYRAGFLAGLAAVATALGVRFDVGFDDTMDTWDTLAKRPRPNA